MLELCVLALNCGSSSLKFGLYRTDASRTEMLLAGEAEAIGDEGSKFWARDSHGDALPADAASIASQQDAIIRIERLLADANMRPDAIGHRIVHGGPKLRRHCPIDDEVLVQLEAASAFAPLHTHQRWR